MFKNAPTCFRSQRIQSSGSLVQCLAKITEMVLSCPLAWTRSVLWQHIVTGCVCVVHCIGWHCSASLYSELNYTHAQPVTICCHNTDYVHVNRHDRTTFGSHCSAFLYCELNYVHAQRVTICCHNTDQVHVNGHDRTTFGRHCSASLYSELNYTHAQRVRICCHNTDQVDVNGHDRTTLGPPYTVNYTNAQRVRLCCHNTDYVHVNGHDRPIFVIFSQALYKDSWWWILFDPNNLQHFKIFYNFNCIYILYIVH